MRCTSLSPPQIPDHSFSKRIPSLEGHEADSSSEISSVEELMESYNGIEPEQVGYEGEIGPGTLQPIQGMMQGMALAPADYMGMNDYLVGLDKAARAFYDSGDQQILARYTG
jgi:hypothetical protein